MVIAAVAALGLIFLLPKLLAPRPVVQPAPAAPVAEKPTTQVLVAKRDLPIGTRLAPTDLDWQPWPQDAVSTTFITDAGAGGAVHTAEAVFNGGGPAMQAVAGSIVREPIAAKEPITLRKLVKGGEGGYMAVVLQPGMRAVAVPVTVETAAGGFILPGDRVDVLMSHKVEQQGSGSGGAGQMAVTETVLRNLRVLAIDQQIEPQKNARTIVGTTATLEVPAGATETLVRARAQGDLALTLRSYADIGGGAVRGEGGSTSTVRLIRAGRTSEVTAR